MPPPQVTVPSSASAQRQRFAAAYSVLEQGVSQQAFPGAVFGVLVGGEVQALDGIGGLTYGQSIAAVNASTVYDLASVTKVIATTSMAMLLYQEGRLSLDQPLVQIFPAFCEGETAGGARSEAREEGGCDDGGRRALVNSRLQRPATLAGIRNPSRELL